MDIIRPIFLGFDNMEIIKGVIKEVKGCFLTLATGEELIKAYIKKNLMEKIPLEGSEVEIRGIIRQFRDGNNYFVIRQFIEENDKKIKVRYIDKNNDLSRLERVHEFFKNKCGAGKGIRVIYEDSQTGEKLEKTLLAEDWDITVQKGERRLPDGTRIFPYYFYNALNVYYYNGINLAAKKYGSKIEAKIKIEITKIVNHWNNPDKNEIDLPEKFKSFNKKGVYQIYIGDNNIDYLNQCVGELQTKEIKITVI